MASNSSEDEVESLPNIFKEGLNLFNNLGKIDEPSNSPSVQGNVKKAMRLLEKATMLVSIADIFSENESVEEISTNNLQYLLLPALLGSLSLKLTSGNRKDLVHCADVYFKDFLRRCNQYNLSNYQFKDTEGKEEKPEEGNRSEFDVIASQINTRATKIQKFKEQKELEAKLKDLEQNIENEHCDDEIKRNYFLTMIKLFILQAVDELSSIEMEKQILEHMSNFGPEERPKKGPQPQPLRPIIITRDAVQKAVYGAGYPSLPTMTVQEFYDKRVADGIFPDPHQKPAELSLQQASLAGVSLNNEDEEEEQDEKRIESEDPEFLENLRRRDEFKDNHRRGWGNRMNRS